MTQHFLLSARAVTLSLLDIAEMGDEEAYATFKAVRFADNEGKPYCPHPECDRAPAYEFKCRREFKCKLCEKRFSATTGTVFASRKLSFKKLLIAMKLFVDGVSGHAALRLRRDLGVSYKSAFVLAQKMREAMGHQQNDRPLTGDVEIDGVYIGGAERQPNMKISRVADRRFGNEKRRAIVTFKERRSGGRSRSFVYAAETDAVPKLLEIVDASAIIVSDCGSAWGKLYLHFEDHQTVNHTLGHVIDGIHINGVESYHSRIRRGERGVYLHINGAHAQNYADEFSWREDRRRVSNGQQFKTLLRGLATMPASGKWVGYWQRRPKPPGVASAA